ncbi:hypothetical protein GEMRC1_001471 [Eukaryota sp. GEM-RC1]
MSSSHSHCLLILLSLTTIVFAWNKDDINFSLDLRFISGSSQETQTSNEDTLSFTDHNNATFVCSLPTIESVSNVNLSSIHPKELLAPLQNLSLNYITNTYFHYQLRPGRAAIQFHTDLAKKKVPTDEIQAYLLGTSNDFTPLLDPARLLATDSKEVVPIEGSIVYASDSTDEPYFVETLSDGTPCTNSDTMRSAEVRYMCGVPHDGLSAALENVIEDKTCHYVLTVRTPLLCKHKEFARFKPSAKVVCSTNSMSMFGGNIKVTGEGSIQIR